MKKPTKLKGRGALSNRAGRFAKTESERVYDDLEDEELVDSVPTELHADASRSIVARNRSPDIPFDQSINPYRGCEHGCIYCYARATHSYLDLSPGRDFETQIYYKPRAVELLRKELARPGYQVSPIALGTNTDPYQPAERRLELTRGILELLHETRHPVSIVTKSGLVLRDLDVLERLAQDGLVAVFVSVTTLDKDLKRRLEPRTAGPERRLQAIRELSRHGVPTGVMAAPVIPALNDHELERILEASADAGARSAGYVLLRLPHEVRPLFVEWLNEHFPDRAEHVLSLVRQMRDGRLNDPRFHSRQRGAGPYAELLKARFERARRACGLTGSIELDTALFRRPRPATGQLELL
ncbi:MAG: PA0069 family radical SAM protein [Gammaproteobacteria bacterium]|nr:PA0069 family radical SAM protein [Gammaproteobacteria bacterium]